VLKSISEGTGEGHICVYGQDVLQFSLLYPYNNQVLPNGRGPC